MALKKRFLFPLGILKNTRKEIPGHVNFEGIIAEILKKLKTPFADECCPTLSEGSPVRYKDGALEYYDKDTNSWTAVV